MGWLFLGLLAILVVGFVSAYNGLVGARNAYRNAFAQIGVQLTRRHDLIPNLVETAKAYLRHERETLEAVVAARGRAVSGLEAAKARPEDAEAMQRLAGAESALGVSLGRLLAVSESYPELKANQTMMSLSGELSATENRISSARQAYNEAVMGYNNQCEMFPSNFVATMFKFGLAQSLELDTPEVRSPPAVSFQ
jgi:LemA protein